MPDFKSYLAQLRYVISIVFLGLYGTTTFAGDASFPIKVGTKPESITKAFDGDFFISIMNNKEEGDGEVVRLSKNGVEPFAKGFDEPKGLAFVGGNLYVTDVTRVWKINSKGQASAFAAKDDFPAEAMYLNDLAADADSKGLYVTDMGAVKFMRDDSGALWPLNSMEAKKAPSKGRVYHISLDRKISVSVDYSDKMKNPNGVAVSQSGSLLIGGFFSGRVLEFKDKKLHTIAKPFRGADTVEQDSKGNIYISSWSQGKVWRISHDSNQVEELLSGLKSAADFYLDEANGRILIPDMLAGELHEIKI